MTFSGGRQRRPRAAASARDLRMARPRRAAALAWTVLDGEAIILDVQTTRSYTLSGVGTAFWQALTGRRTLGDIARRLSRDLDAPPERIEDDLLSLFTQLESEGLVTLGG